MKENRPQENTSCTMKWFGSCLGMNQSKPYRWSPKVLSAVISRWWDFRSFLLSCLFFSVLFESFDMNIYYWCQKKVPFLFGCHLLFPSPQKRAYGSVPCARCLSLNLQVSPGHWWQGQRSNYPWWAGLRRHWHLHTSNSKHSTGPRNICQV